jgi:hypothetical protein
MVRSSPIGSPAGLAASPADPSPILAEPSFRDSLQPPATASSNTMPRAVKEFLCFMIFIFSFFEFGALVPGQRTFSNRTRPVLRAAGEYKRAQCA